MELIKRTSMGITATPDLIRIRDLPVRAHRTQEDLETLAVEMTDALKTPGGTMKLRPVQALALYEAMTCKGVFGPMGVGTGKTLVTLLLPTVCNFKRPILLLPAQLVEKTERERRALMVHWNVARNLRIFSYEMLGRVNAANALDIWMPDAIIADEAHRLKNKRAACVRRVSRRLKEHPETPFFPFSGTMIKTSFHDFAHLLRWALGSEGAPIPKHEGELIEWAEALDEKINPLRRRNPGALVQLDEKVPDTVALVDTEGDELAEARVAFRRRLIATPGVVASLKAEQVACSLFIEGHVYPCSNGTNENFKTLRTKAETPDGWALTEATEVWRHARELALGLCYVWDPRPPEDWLMSRRAWASFVRQVLSHSRTLDTELQVKQAIDKSELRDEIQEEGEKLLKLWRRLEPTFKISSKALWYDDSALNVCAEWMGKNSAGIVWTEHTLFGRELAKRTGRPYFGQAGLDGDGNYIENASGPIIASIDANGTGKNLQFKWSQNLFVTCPSGGEVHEQTIGRTHRPGQEADEVTVEILLGCREGFEAWERALGSAHMAEQTMGQPQKILFADVNMPEMHGLAGARWARNQVTLSNFGQ